jgi:hypothetical protein
MFTAIGTNQIDILNAAFNDKPCLLVDAQYTHSIQEPMLVIKYEVCF